MGASGSGEEGRVMKSHRPLSPYLWLIGILCLGVVLLTFGVDVRMTGEAGVIATELPAQVGGWRGERVLHCLNKQCRRSFHGDECLGLEACPDCEGQVNAMSSAEYHMLPKDTILNRQLYHHSSGRSVQAAVVLSGRHRSSLHRPELCLTVSGSDIATTHQMKVNLKDGSTLQVRVLDMLSTIRLPDGRTTQSASYYAYWFAGRHHRTPNHVRRMLLMAMDKVLFSKIDRWAYISVGGPRDLDSTEHLDEAREFIQEFYPLIEITDFEE